MVLITVGVRPKIVIILVVLLIRVHVVTVLQEAAFRKVVQTTMVRDRQHGPVIELNRIQVNTKFYYEKENLARS